VVVFRNVDVGVMLELLRDIGHGLEEVHRFHEIARGEFEPERRSGSFKVPATGDREGSFAGLLPTRLRLRIPSRAGGAPAREAFARFFASLDPARGCHLHGLATSGAGTPRFSRHRDGEAPGGFGFSASNLVRDASPNPILSPAATPRRRDSAVATPRRRLMGGAGLSGSCTRPG
jgi:hypothetical protein